VCQREGLADFTKQRYSLFVASSGGKRIPVSGGLAALPELLRPD
jgi:hypothetical protein